MDEFDQEYCTCDEEDYPPEQCPYYKAVYEEEMLCTCCPYCRQWCEDDI